MRAERCRPATARSWSHTMAALQDLHWLPVKYRIAYKLASLMFFTSGVQCIFPTSSSSTPSALSGDFVPSTTRAAGLRCFWPRHLEYSFPCYSCHRLLPCFPAFAENTPISSCFELVPIRVFIVDYVMHGRPIFFLLLGTITFIYNYDYDYDYDHEVL